MTQPTNLVNRATGGKNTHHLSREDHAMKVHMLKVRRRIEEGDVLVEVR